MQKTFIINSNSGRDAGEMQTTLRTGRGAGGSFLPEPAFSESHRTESSCNGEEKNMTHVTYWMKPRSANVIFEAPIW